MEYSHSENIYRDSYDSAGFIQKSISDFGIDRFANFNSNGDFFSSACNNILKPTSRSNSLAKCMSLFKCGSAGKSSMSNLAQLIQELPTQAEQVQIQASLSQAKQAPKVFMEMASFPVENVVDFKHLIYNLLVENYNHSNEETFVEPICMEILGVVRHGFRFNESFNPDKTLAELYARHIRKAELENENQNSVFIQDLYKFYLRACTELLSKYFVKQDKHTFFYDDIALFIPGGNIKDAEARISKMGTIQRKQKKRNSSESDGINSVIKQSKRKRNYWTGTPFHWASDL